MPTGKLVHAVVDNYATHNHPKMRAWLTRHPRWTFHFTPTPFRAAKALRCSTEVTTKRMIAETGLR